MVFMIVPIAVSVCHKGEPGRRAADRVPRVHRAVMKMTGVRSPDATNSRFDSLSVVPY